MGLDNVECERRGVHIFMLTFHMANGSCHAHRTHGRWDENTDWTIPPTPMDWNAKLKPPRSTDKTVPPPNVRVTMPLDRF